MVAKLTDLATTERILQLREMLGPKAFEIEAAAKKALAQCKHHTEQIKHHMEQIEPIYLLYSETVDCYWTESTEMVSSDCDWTRAMRRFRYI